MKTIAIYFGDLSKKKQKTNFEVISCQWFLFSTPTKVTGLFWDAGGSEPDQTERKLLWICTSCLRTVHSWICSDTADPRAHDTYLYAQRFVSSGPVGK